MEKDQETSDDTSNYHGGIGKSITLDKYHYWELEAQNE